MIGPSSTSVWAAMGRAFGSREPDAKVRNPDWLAGKLVGPQELALMQDHPLVSAINRPYEEASRDMEVIAASRSMIPRTRFIDERLEAAVGNGTTQLVILGAGFDSRAYRFEKLLTAVRVFEVDHPATQEVKIQRVREVVGEPPENLVYLAVDFRKDDLTAALSAEGYRKDRRTFFIWEGVTMYLPAEAVHETLRWIAVNSASGSSVVFDYFSETAVRVMANPAAFPIPAPMKESIERFKRLNPEEPFVYGVPNDKEADLLIGEGLTVGKVLGLNSSEAVETYLTRTDGTIYGNLPATEQQGYLILEAFVP